MLLILLCFYLCYSFQVMSVVVVQFLSLQTLYLCNPDMLKFYLLLFLFLFCFHLRPQYLLGLKQAKILYIFHPSLHFVLISLLFLFHYQDSFLLLPLVFSLPLLLFLYQYLHLILFLNQNTFLFPLLSLFDLLYLRFFLLIYPFCLMQLSHIYNTLVLDLLHIPFLLHFPMSYLMLYAFLALLPLLYSLISWLFLLPYLFHQHLLLVLLLFQVLLHLLLDFQVIH